MNIATALGFVSRMSSLHWQTGVLSFSGAATPQMFASLEMLGMVKICTVTCLDGHRVGRKSKERAAEQGGQVERDMREDQR